MSRDINIPSTSSEVDGRWIGPDGPILAEVKRTHSVRDVRGVFMALAYLLHDEDKAANALCVLVDSRLSPTRLDDELQRFRSVIHPAIADRVHFMLVKRGSRNGILEFRGSLNPVPQELYAWLRELIANEYSAERARRLPSRQLVVTALAQLRLWNQPPVTVKHLQQTCQVSYPTVAAVLKDLQGQGWLEDSNERGVRLRPLTTGEWMELARDHAKQREVHLFADPTGQSSPEQLRKRLHSLQAKDKLPRTVRIGGVIGASRHFPALDITAAPRLDLSVEHEPAHVAAMLDAGLVPKSRADQRIALALHVTRDPWTITNLETATQEQWASELECLSDLVEMGYTREATEMAQDMELINTTKEVLA